MGRAALLPLLALLFVLSGAAGLAYEVVWSRYLGLFVGHDAYGQVLTLVMFLGGMGIGALVVSRRSGRIADPLLAYALVEALIGAIGLVFHDLLYVPVTGWAYDTLFPALGAGAVPVAKWLLAGLLILPQSILLGATFPLMTAGALRRLPERPGRTLSILYFANSLGAAAGVLIAGFYLFALAGLPGTLIVAAAANLFVGLGAILARRLLPAPEPAVPEAVEPAHPGTDPAGRLGLDGLTRILLILAAGTAVASFVYEVAWIRMLSLVLGSSTHAFELMLSAFILGLALGALWIRRRADLFADPLRALVIVQLVMGAVALASIPLYLSSFHWSAFLLQATARTDPGYVLFTVARYGVCLAIMLPATFCAGMTLPLMTRMLLAAGAGERAIGAVYGINTLGSILGAAFTGLVLLPALGLRGTLVFGASLDMLLGLVAAAGLALAGRPARALALAGAGALVAGVLLVLLAVPWDQRTLASGVFRVGRVLSRTDRKILFHEDGRTATVHASEFASGTRAISTNGKTDGSLPPPWFRPCSADAGVRAFSGDEGTQVLLALLALAYAPQARRGAVIGHGTGMSSHLLLGSPALSRLVTIEIEPAMVRGSRVFHPANRRVFEDPRSTIAYRDARAFFAGSRQRYDLVLSEPSNPWVSGVSGLFTVEFYEGIKRHLAPGAVFGQWLHTYEMSDGLVIGVLAGLHEQFADYRVFLVNAADLLVVATADGPLPEPDWTVFDLPGVREDLCRFGPIPPEALERLAILDRSGAASLLETGIRPNSDFYPALDLGAERARFLRETAAGFTGLWEAAVPFVRRARPAREPDSTVLGTAIESVAPVRAFASAVRLRGVRRAVDDSASPAELREWQRLGTWEAGARSGLPPASWRDWTAATWSLFRALHGGDLPADTAFFRRAVEYAARARAPEPVHAAIGLARALTGRDPAGGAAAARVLLAEARAGRDWIPVDDLLDGAVRALAETGEAGAARRAFETLMPRSSRRSGDLRLLLLDAEIERARGDR